MTRAKDQLSDEATYSHLAKFLRAGGTFEVGENYPIGSFARIRIGNKTQTVNTEYRDLAAVLKEMDSQARIHFEQQS